MIRRPPRSTLFPTRRSSDLEAIGNLSVVELAELIEKFKEKFGVTIAAPVATAPAAMVTPKDRKSTRLNSSHGYISYAVFCLKKNKTSTLPRHTRLHTDHSAA